MLRGLIGGRKNRGGRGVGEDNCLSHVCYAEGVLAVPFMNLFSKFRGFLYTCKPVLGDTLLFDMGLFEYAILYLIFVQASTSALRGSRLKKGLLKLSVISKA